MVFDGGVGAALATEIINDMDPRNYVWISRDGVYQETGPDAGKNLITETPHPITGTPGLPIVLDARPAETLVDCDGQFFLSAQGLAWTPKIGDHVNMEGELRAVVDLRLWPDSGERHYYRVFYKGEAPDGT